MNEQPTLPNLDGLKAVVRAVTDEHGRRVRLALLAARVDLWWRGDLDVSVTRAELEELGYRIVAPRPALFDDPARDDAPGRVRTDDHRTSRQGADLVAYRAGSQKRRLLEAFGIRVDLTDEEAAAAAGLPPTSCYWKRCGELRADGAIAATGRTRVSSAGVERIVSAITPRGRELLRRTDPLRDRG